MRKTMTPYRTLLYLVKRQRKYEKLIIPFSFFILETSLIMLIVLNIFGFNIFSLNDGYKTEPMIYVKMIHPPEVFDNVEYASILPLVKINEAVSPLITFANFVSILVAIVGAVIAILWMNRFFKINNLNIEWWVWPIGCAMSHILFFIVMI